MAHLALFSQLSDATKASILHNAPKQRLALGETLFASKKDDDPNSNAAAFVVVLHGRLDIYCVEDGGTSTSAAGLPADTPSSAESIAEQAATVLPKAEIVSLTRGQTFGDQMISLGSPHIWASSSRRLHQAKLRFTVVSGDASTEVLWVSRDLYEHQAREDRLRLSYNPILATSYATNAAVTLASVIETREISQITRQLLTDATLAKFFFQFPPLVLERLCHDMEVRQYDAKCVFLGAGDDIDVVSVVVAGALHSHYENAQRDSNTAKKPLSQQGSERRINLSRDIHFLPGDAFGARELCKQRTTCEAAVLADAGTLVLCIARSSFERWVAPMHHNTITNPGGILQSLAQGATSPRALSSKYTSSLKMSRRQSGPSTFSAASAAFEKERGKTSRLNEAAILLKRRGLYRTLPRFLLAQMLAHATLVTKQAGEELFREGDMHQSLVVILSGFVSFYSVEHMAATVEMFQNHPFCHFAAFAGSTTSPEDYLAEPRADESTGSPNPSPRKHRAVIHGVHIQTLPSLNAFRTGVLQEGAVCPATVLAQTDCEYMVFDESVYSQVLAQHAPAVNMSDYVALAVPPTESKASSLRSPSDSTTKGVESRPGAIPAPLLSYLEEAKIPWLPDSSAKRKLLFRSMQYVVLTPGQRLIQYNDVVKQVVLVVSGKLAVSVRENQEAISVLNASQRSVQSVTLEHSVTSNYSTTSQQLYRERPASRGLTGRSVLRRKIARISEQEPTERPPEPLSPVATGRFTDFAMAAARETKARQGGNSEAVRPEGKEPQASRNTRKSFHSMVNKVNFQRKFGSQKATDSSVERSSTCRSLFQFHLWPGDIYGDEVTAPTGVFRSVHDIFVDNSPSSSLGSSSSSDLTAGSGRSTTTSVLGAEVLCLDRHVFHSILSKSEEDVENELQKRSLT
ncbi:hypothetical protein BBJ28_00001506, partial [Nothophytophthora sp. Chile5]